LSNVDIGSVSGVSILVDINYFHLELGFWAGYSGHQFFSNEQRYGYPIGLSLLRLTHKAWHSGTSKFWRLSPVGFMAANGILESRYG
jgi:hypothetical protein